MKHANTENSQTVPHSFSKFQTFQNLFPKFITTSSELVLEGWKVFLEFLIFFPHYFQPMIIWKFVPKQELRVLFMDGLTCCSRENRQEQSNETDEKKAPTQWEKCREDLFQTYGENVTK